MAEISLYEFVAENTLLVGLAVGSGIALVWPTLSRGTNGATDLSAAEAVLLLNRAKPLILDVRNADEFASGHIQGAKNIPLADLAGRIKEIEKFKSKPVLVHCQRGGRAKSAIKILKAQEFNQLNHLQGDLDAWIDAKLPLVKS